MQKEQQIKLSEMGNTITDWKYEQQVKKEERLALDQDTAREII